MSTDSRQTTRAIEATDIPSVVAALKATYASGRTRDAEWRKSQLLAIEKMMTENEAVIIEAMDADLGRKPFESWMADVASTAAEASYAAKNVAKWMRRKYRRLELSQYPGRGWVEHEPYGTVLVIGAWNFPFNLTLGPLIGAISAGNTVAIKPSEIAPASSRVMARLVPQYLDSEAIAVVEGDGEVSQELISQGFGHVIFTGGTEIGRKVYESAASHLTPVTLELGGKCPVVIAADADIGVAAKRIVWTKLIGGGQACIAPDYVLADSSIHDELVSKIGEAIAEFEAGGSGRERVVNKRHFDRLTGALAATKGTIAFGGGASAAANEIEPTVVLNPDPHEPLMTDEIFGPILPIMTVRSLDEAISFVNSRPKPLAAYLFTKSRKVRERFIKEVPSGGMLINHVALHITTSRLPFGGVGPSGTGAYHGKFGFEEFSHAKAVLTKTTRPDLNAMIYPPYTAKGWKLARRIF
jgi:aldehyde dehydrogenase (NAD+)